MNMPNLPSYTLLDRNVKKRQTDRSLETTGLAFEWVALETILELNSFEIEDALVDAGMDGGIDAIYIQDRDVHILTFTYAQTFEAAGKRFPQNKLDNLTITVEKIYQRKLVDADVNPALWEKIQEIWDLFDSIVPNFHFHICSNKEKPSEAAIRRFEDTLAPYRFVDFVYWDLEDIVSTILQSSHRPVDGSVSFIDRLHFLRVMVI
jgi:hypothetical protein